MNNIIRRNKKIKENSRARSKARTYKRITTMIELILMRNLASTQTSFWKYNDR